MIRVTSAGFATVQDLGWRAGRAMGLPRAGALDRVALQLANALVGNPPEAAGVEVALGELTVTFTASLLVAVAGAARPVSVDGRSAPPGTTLRVAEGQRLSIGRADGGRLAYLAVRGGVAVPAVLGSRSTYLPAGFGGLEGRLLRPGDELPVGESPDLPAPPPGFSWGGAVRQPDPSPIRVLAGPQADLFPPGTQASLERTSYTVAPQSDRMGTRLTGPPLAPHTRSTLPSEGTCVGAMQVPDGGQPIVILADGPTVGGYPKLAVVIGADLDRFAQIRPGHEVRFQWVGMTDAQRALHQARADLESAVALIRAARSFAP
jgi:biotin-dependent carboxylase-like uncharacterized protein